MGQSGWRMLIAMTTTSTYFDVLVIEWDLTPVVQDLSVTCSGISTPYYEGEVRLVGGAYASEGVVEIYQWAQVCSTDMEPRLADSICRQPGYTGQISIQPLHNTTGLYWPLSSSNCTSSQSCISHCLPSLPAGPQPLSTCTGDNM